MIVTNACLDKNWFVYILQLDGKKLYTGITTDIERRHREHIGQKVRSARAVRGSREIQLVYQCQVEDKGTALRIEHRIKKLTRSQKDLIIERNFDTHELCEFLGVRTKK